MYSNIFILNIIIRYLAFVSKNYSNIYLLQYSPFILLPECVSFWEHFLKGLMKVHVPESINFGEKQD